MIVKKLKALERKYPLNLNFQVSKSVILAGVSRSGTTWVSEVINHKNIYRDIFEPFHPKQVELFKDYNDRTYLRPSSSDPLILTDVKQVVSGRLRSPWSDQYNRRLISRKRIIKSIRANLFLGWLNRNFPDVPIILLLRHPCAVASSKLQLSSISSPREWDTNLDKYLAQSTLVQDYLLPFIKHLEETDDLYKKDFGIFENCIFGWCIENYVPLTQIKNGQLKSSSVHICFYEDLCMDLVESARGIFDFLGSTYDVKSLLQLSKRPSSQATEFSAVRNNKNPVGSWQNKITQSQKDRAMDILSLFKLDSIYTLDSLPNPEGLSMFFEN